MAGDDRRDGPGDLHRRRRGRNLALFAALLVLVVLFYLITIVRLGTV